MKTFITMTIVALSLLLVAGCGGRIVTSGDYVLESGKTLSGDLTVFSGDVVLEEESQVTGDIFMTSGNLDANGEIDGDIFFTSGDVDLGPEAVVHGDILATSGNVHRAEGSRVDGEVVINPTRFPIGSGAIAGVLGSFCALPLVFVALLIMLIMTFTRRRSVPRAEATTAAPARKLQQLRQMLEKGLITEADFENKKAEILSTM